MKAAGFRLSLAIVLIATAVTLVFNYTQFSYKALHRGEGLFYKGRFEEAEGLFISALQANPRNLDAAFYLLAVYEKLGFREKARELLKLLSRSNPADSRVAERLGDLYYRDSDYAVAETLYHQALAINKYASPELKRKLAEVMLWQKEYPQALPLLEELHYLQPRDVRISVLLADAYLWGGYPSQAAVLYRSIISSGSRSQSIMLKFADSLRLSGKDEEALRWYEEYFLQE
jgi:tetratricopeptide (TPR) repeat protein